MREWHTRYIYARIVITVSYYGANREVTQDPTAVIDASCCVPGIVASVWLHIAVTACSNL